RSAATRGTRPRSGYAATTSTTTRTRPSSSRSPAALAERHPPYLSDKPAGLVATAGGFQGLRLRSAACWQDVGVEVKDIVRVVFAFDPGQAFVFLRPVGGPHTAFFILGHEI